MRINQYITSLWSGGGPYVGDNKPHGRVTVQLPWDDLSGEHKYDFLRTTYDVGVGTYAHRGVPLRWHQNFANDQVELEIPNVKQIHTTRSVDSDAGTFEIDIYNQTMFDNDGIPVGSTELGQPGYFSAGRGVSLDSQARWGQTKNQWENLLVPNALIRTYQGYGGHGKTIEQAVADGNIMLTGLWLADHVEIHTDGTIKISGRDGAKLLIDQQLYIPLIPKEDYPLTYYRFILFNQPVRAAAVTVSGTQLGSVAPGEKRTVYETSEVDAWYGYNFDLHGHHPTDAFDGNPDSYYMSVGNSRPDAAFADAWLQATCGEGMNAVYVNPWAGNYQLFVSVMEHGVWQGTDTIPYDYHELVGTQPYWVDTGANIPYVASFGVPWETAQEYILPRVYDADRVRITLRNLTYTEFGPWQYRGGVREFAIRASDGGPGSVGSGASMNLVIEPVFISADRHPDNGFVTLTQLSQVDALGEARNEPFNGFAFDNSAALAVRMSRTGNGYYMLHQNGWAYTFGDAAYYGDLHDSFDLTTQPLKQANDMALTADGTGYWILQSDGTITGFGSVAGDVFHCPIPGDRAFTFSLESHDDKLWALDTSGRVYTFRGAVHYGNFSPFLPANPPFPTENAISIRTTNTGLGYWIATNLGAVGHFGDAPDVGSLVRLPLDADWRTGIWEIITVPDSDAGIMLLKGDGTVLPLGNVPYGDIYAGPASGVDQQRKDGNYLDWTDIIRDLALWSGFLLYDPDLAANAVPAVFGNLESTGSYSPDDLPADMFDKKPVIDAMHAIKEAVGYLIWVDDEGGFRFESPNWWAPGNFDEVGDHTNQMLQLDESVTLIDYTATFTDDVLRSLIIISSEDPDQGTGATITTRLIPASKRQLRGLVKPAMWVNGYFTKPEEQKIMAELIALHTWFQTRVGQVTCVANPCLQINDQVRIWERQTSESYVHYVRGVDTTMDLDAGSYTMTVTTNWLGDETSWAIQDAGTFTSVVDPDDPRTTWVVSPALANVLHTQFGSKAANLFGAPVGSVLTSLAPGSQDGTGSGPT